MLTTHVLQQKTKRTILENDQLGKELGYHIRQTELLLQKNEKLVQENVELHRQVLLAKEVFNNHAPLFFGCLML